MWDSWLDLCTKHHFLPLYSNDLSNNLCLVNENIQKNKFALMTVGSTEFSKLTEVFFSEKLNQFLYESGYRTLILQVSSLGLFEKFEKQNINQKIVVKVFKFLPYHKFNEYLQKADLELVSFYKH